MSSFDPIALAAAIESLPERFWGPGGAVGVVRDGEVVVREAWGYLSKEQQDLANLEATMAIEEWERQRYA